LLRSQRRKHFGEEERAWLRRNKDGKQKGKLVMFERRRFVRIPGSFVVFYRDITNEVSKADVTQTKNISLGGLLFSTDRQFEAGRILELKIKLPTSPDYIVVNVRVVDSKQIVKNLLSDTRVKFISLKEEDRDAIRKLVEHYS